MHSMYFYHQLITRDFILKTPVKTIYDCPKITKGTVSLSHKFISAEKLVVLPYFVALLLWTGQRPTLIRAKKSVATFGLKKSAPFGCFVTLRKDSLAHFVDKLCLAVFPRLQQNTPESFLSFNKNTVNFGLDAFLKCTEIQPNTDMFDFLEGCSCSFVTSASTVHQTQLYCSGLHFPVLKKKKINGKL